MLFSYFRDKDIRVQWRHVTKGLTYTELSSDRIRPQIRQSDLRTHPSNHYNLSGFLGKLTKEPELGM